MSRLLLMHWPMRCAQRSEKNAFKDYGGRFAGNEHYHGEDDDRVEDLSLNILARRTFATTRKLKRNFIVPA